MGNVDWASAVVLSPIAHADYLLYCCFASTPRIPCCLPFAVIARPHRSLLGRETSCETEISRNFEYVEGDSLIELPKWIEKNQALLGAYDLIHVDGGHSEECIQSDMLYADKLVCVGGNIIVDDSDDSNIKKCIESFLISGRYIELNILKTENVEYPNGQVHKGYPHRVIQKRF